MSGTDVWASAESHGAVKKGQEVAEPGERGRDGLGLVRADLRLISGRGAREGLTCHVSMLWPSEACGPLRHLCIALHG